jgi:hypothetical protein
MLNIPFDEPPYLKKVGKAPNTLRDQRQGKQPQEEK